SLVMGSPDEQQDGPQHAACPSCAARAARPYFSLTACSMFVAFVVVLSMARSYPFVKANIDRLRSPCYICQREYMSRRPDVPFAALDHALRALSDPTRLRILGLLTDGEVCVCHIYEALK